MKLDLNESLYPRERYLRQIRGFYHESEIIKVITGVRRCGKSSIMKLIIREIIADGVCEDNILYFNLDRRPYSGITKPNELDSLIEEHSPIPRTNMVYSAREYCLPRTHVTLGVLCLVVV